MDLLFVQIEHIRKSHVYSDNYQGLNKRSPRKERMKGKPVYIVAHPKSVEVWLSSPTGDSSDSHIMHMMCMDSQQAFEIAQEWGKAWGMAWYTANGQLHDPSATYIYPEYV